MQKSVISKMVIKLIVILLSSLSLVLAGDNAEGLIDCISAKLAGLPTFRDIDLEKEFGLILNEDEWNNGNVKFKYKRKNKPAVQPESYADWKIFFDNNLPKNTPGRQTFLDKCLNPFAAELDDECSTQKERDDMKVVEDKIPESKKFQKYGGRYFARLKCIDKKADPKKRGGIGDFARKVRFEATNDHKLFKKLVADIKSNGASYKLEMGGEVSLTGGGDKEKFLKEKIQEAYDTFLEHFKVISVYDSFSKSYSDNKPNKLTQGMRIFDESDNAKIDKVKNFDILTGESC